MLKKILFLMLFFPVFAGAEQPVIKIDLLVTSNGNILFSDPITVLGEPTVFEEGDYSAVIVDEKGNALYTVFFSLEPAFFIDEELEPDPEKTRKRIENSFLGKKTLYIPLLEKMSDLIVYSPLTTASLPLNKMICNNDNACNNNENILGCLNDCTVFNDNFCTPFEDGICDPDCFKGIDKDCSTTKKNTDKKQGIYSNPVFLVLAFLLLIIVTYFVLKRVKKGRAAKRVG